MHARGVATRLRFCLQIEEIEVRRKVKELVARVQLPADAEAYQIRQVDGDLMIIIHVETVMINWPS